MINQVSELAFISPAYANDGLQLSVGAEAEHVSVGAEGSHCVGAAPRGAEFAVSLLAGYFPAAILAPHSLHLSTTDGSTGTTADYLRDGRAHPSPTLLTGCCHVGGGGLTLGTCELRDCTRLFSGT